MESCFDAMPKIVAEGRRSINAWIITTLLVAGFVFLGAWLSIEVFQWVISEGYYIEITNLTALLVSVTVLLALLTIVNFVVSYILFCRMQVVGRTWCNC